jgi:hypothetical protein
MHGVAEISYQQQKLNPGINSIAYLRRKAVKDSCQNRQLGDWNGESEDDTM